MAMKKIEATIRPEPVERVRRAPEALTYPALTLNDVKGHGKQQGIPQQWPGKEYVTATPINADVRNGE